MSYGPRPFSVDGVLADYQAGLLLSEIAAKHGTTKNSIMYWVRKEGLPRRQPHQSHPQRKDVVTYFSYHDRVRSARGRPRFCEECKSTTAKAYDWANLTGKYEDIDDYVRLCRSCHVRKDGHWRNLPRLKNAELRRPAC